jgi:hypothetical protein
MPAPTQKHTPASLKYQDLANVMAGGAAAAAAGTARYSSISYCLPVNLEASHLARTYCQGSSRDTTAAAEQPVAPTLPHTILVSAAVW